MQESIVPGVSLKRIEGIHVASVSHRGSPEEIGLAFVRLFWLLRERHLRPAGPMIALYDNLPSPRPNHPTKGISAAVPVIRKVPGNGELRFMDLPAGEVASLIWDGLSSRRGEGFEILRRWIQDHGLIRARPIREIYSRDVSELPPGIDHVEIQIPVRRRRARGRRTLIRP